MDFYYNESSQELPTDDEFYRILNTVNYNKDITSTNLQNLTYPSEMK